MPLSTLANLLFSKLNIRSAVYHHPSADDTITNNNESYNSQPTLSSDNYQYELDYSSDSVDESEISTNKSNGSCFYSMTSCLSSRTSAYRTPNTRRYTNKRVVYNSIQNDLNSTIQYTNDGQEHNKYTLDTIINTYGTQYKYNQYTSPDVTPYQTPQHSPRSSMNNKYTGRKLIFDFNVTNTNHITHGTSPYKNNSTTRIVQLPMELNQLICEYLQFKDVCNYSMTCTELLDLCNDRQQYSLSTLPYVPLDRGDGLGCELVIQNISNHTVIRNDWRIAYCARETIYNRVYAQTKQYLCKSSESYVTEHIRIILNIMCCNVRDINCVEESLRWIVQLHDTYGDLLLAPQCSDDTIKCIVSMYKRYSNKSSVIQMCSKVIGILSTQEYNRPKMTQYNGVKHLLQCITTHINDIKILANICWALVIIARPLGALEGSTFIHPAKQTTANINYIVDHHGIENIIYIIQQHKYSPHVLCKAYWCLVNLSIVQEHKQRAIELNAITLIIESLQLFPLHPQLQYRATFALINLAIRPDVKQQLRSSGGIELLLRGMKQFPTYRVYQKCACVVLRSICYNSPGNSELLIRLGGIELICSLIFRWRSNSEFVKLGLTTLECIDCPIPFIDRIESITYTIDQQLQDGTLVIKQVSAHTDQQLSIRDQLEQADDIEGYHIPNISHVLYGDDDEYDTGLTEQQIMQQEQQAKQIALQHTECKLIIKS